MLLQCEQPGKKVVKAHAKMKPKKTFFRDSIELDYNRPLEETNLKVLSFDTDNASRPEGCTDTELTWPLDTEQMPII